jgi:predicted CoA-binding protein
MKTILIVGASNNPEKYGYKIVKDLAQKGYKVVPINPKENEILSLKAYPTITDFVTKNPSVKIDWIDFVVPPKVTESILKEVKTLNISKVWLQPGSESEESIQYCADNKIKCMHHSCIMQNNDLI